MTQPGRIQDDADWVMVPREMTPAQYDALSANGKAWRDMNSAEVYRILVGAAAPQGCDDARYLRQFAAEIDSVAANYKKEASKAEARAALLRSAADQIERKSANPTQPEQG